MDAVDTRFSNYVGHDALPISISALRIPRGCAYRLRTGIWRIDTIDVPKPDHRLRLVTANRLVITAKRHEPETVHDTYHPSISAQVYSDL